MADGENSVGRRRTGEFWIPVWMSPVQIREYCNVLIENFQLLRSEKPCHDLIKLLISCCGHPYTVSNELVESSGKIVPPQELLLVTIKTSGKLQLMHKMLQEFYAGRKRVLILIQSASAARARGKKLIDILDDYLRQQYGSESYARIERHMEHERAQAGLQRFNSGDSKCFLLLTDRNHSIRQKLYSLDVVFIYESDLNPLHDMLHLQRMGIDTNVKVYRLYSCLSIEEAVLVYAQQGGNINENSKNVILRWGAKLLLEIDDWCLRNGLCTDLRGWQLDRDGADKWKEYLVSLDIPPQMEGKLKLLRQLSTEHTAHCDMDISAKHFWSPLLKDKHAKLTTNLPRESVPKHVEYRREERKFKKATAVKHDFIPVSSSHVTVNQREQEEALLKLPVVAKKKRKRTAVSETEPLLPVFITKHKKRVSTQRPGVLVDHGSYYLYYPAYRELPKDFPKSLVPKVSHDPIVRDQIALLYENNIETLYRCGMLKCDVSNEEELDMYFDSHICRAILWASQFCYTEEWRFHTKRNIVEVLQQEVTVKVEKFQEEEHRPEKKHEEVQKNKLPRLIGDMLQTMLHIIVCDGSLFYVQAQAEQLGLCPDMAEYASLNSLFDEINDEYFQLLLDRLHRLITEGMGVYIRAGTARFLEILVRARPADMKQHTKHWMKRYLQLLDDLLKRVIVEKHHFKKCFAAAFAAVLNCADDAVVEEKLSFMVNMYRSGDMRIEVAVLLNEFCHQAGDRVKDHAIVLLPLTFIGRIDENEFVNIHFQQIWKEHFSHHSMALGSCMPALVALLFDALASSSHSAKQQSAKVIVELLKEVEDSVAPFAKKLMALLLEQLSTSPWKGKVSILEAISAICENCSQVFPRCDQMEIVNTLAFTYLKNKRFFQKEVCSCLVKVLGSFSDIDGTNVLPPIVLEQVLKQRAAQTQKGGLQPVTIDQLKHLSGIHTGCALFGTIMKPGFRCSDPTCDVVIMVLDSNGDITKVKFKSWCFKYDENVLTRLPKHTTLVIKDPEVRDEVIEMETLNKLDIISLFSSKKQADLEKMTARDLREEANRELRRGNLHQALELYGLSIRKAEEEHDLVLGYSNRAQCYLQLHSYERALEDSERALEIDGTHMKSLVRKGISLQRLRLYTASRATLELLKNAPCPEFRSEFRRSLVLELQSVNGTHGLCQNLLGFVSGQNLGNEDFQFADYVGEVEIRESKAGRSLFAAKDFEAGELILVSNALCHVVATEGASHMDWDMIAHAVTELTDNSIAREQFSALASSAVPSISVFKPNRVFNKEKKHEALDVNTIVETVHRYTIKNTDKHGKLTKAGLWLLPSFINHSCIPNICCINIGRVKLFRAVRRLQAGEELLFCYPHAGAPREIREKALKARGLECKCMKCEIEQRVLENAGAGLEAITKGSSDLVLFIESLMNAMNLDHTSRQMVRCAYSHRYARAYEHVKDKLPPAETMMHACVKYGGGQRWVFSIMGCLQKHADDDKDDAMDLWGELALSSFGRKNVMKVTKMLIKGKKLVIT